MPGDQTSSDEGAQRGPVTDDGTPVSRETVASEPTLPPWLDQHRQALVAYADLLGTTGVERGLLGPREVPRLWDRHLLNCLVVADPAAGLVPRGATVIDIGAGAGLPGLCWALARPDLRVILVEPLLRRATFLTEATAMLPGTAEVEVVRARAEELTGRLDADVVTARAVAPLARLAAWAAPLARRGGSILALKGASAAAELERDRAALDRLGIVGIEVLQCGHGVVSPLTTVIRMHPGDGSGGAAGGRRRRPGGPDSRGRRSARRDRRDRPGGADPGAGTRPGDTE